MDDDRLTMLPAPCACITRNSCFMLRSTPSTLVSKVAAKLSAVCSITGPGLPSVPALLTATSRRPNRATVPSTRFCTSLSTRTSARMNSACTPSARNSATSASPTSSRRPETTTRAPCCAKASAVARQVPVSAPVINTTGWLIWFLLQCQLCLLSLAMDSGSGALRGSAGALLLRWRISRSRWRPGERLCKLDAILLRNGWDGAATPPVLRRRGRRRQPDRGGAKAAAHRAAFAEPADSRSRPGALGAVAYPRSARGRTDRIGTSVSRSRADSAAAGRGGHRGGATGGATGEDILHHRFPDRLRDGLASGCDGHPARRITLDRSRHP